MNFMTGEGEWVPRAAPHKDDKLFGADSNLQTSDCIMLPELVYRSGYYAAAFSLAQSMGEAHKDDSLVYPIVYLYRHYVELALKSIMVVAFPILDKELTEQELYGHDLNKLWKKLKPLLNQICEFAHEDPYPPEDIEGIESYVTQLHEYDPDGQRFRYATVKPVKNKAIIGQPLLGNADIRALAISMGKLAEYLEGIEGWFGICLDAKNGIF